MREAKGTTLVELLVATAVLAVVVGIAASGITLALRIQNLNEATTSAQSKVRRIGEVFTQELRSAVLGGITNQPYTSDGTSISFALLDGGAGYQVLPHGSGQNANFVAANTVEIVAPVAAAADLRLTGGQALMVNANGQAVIFPVTQVQASGNGAHAFDVMHPGCNNTIDYTANTLLFKVTTMGMSFDPVASNLVQTVGTGAEAALAFDLSGVTLTYVYERGDGTAVELPTPLVDAGGLPLRTGTAGGVPVTLARVHLNLATEELTTGSRAVQRTVSSHVELSSNPGFFVRKVEPC